MTSTYTQDTRFLRIETPLGKDKLLLRSFSGHEAISQLFGFQIDLLSEDHNINFDEIVGQNITFSTVLAEDETERYFNGFVSRFALLPGEGRLARYHAEVVPWLWFLTRTTDCQIFQNKTVPEIVQQVFEGFGFKDFRIQLHGNYKPWEYCVQYRETACNFVMRLMEQEGIFFFFQHEDGKHLLVMADSPAAHQPCPNQSRIKYEYSTGAGMKRDEDTVDSWRLEHELRPGRYALNEFYFETPNSSLLSSSEGRVTQGGNKSWEIYDYPGEYEKQDEADAYVKLRMDEEETPHAVVSGSSNCRSLVAGFRFDLFNHVRKDQNSTYVLTSVSHTAHAGGTFPGSEYGTSDNLYSNLFKCIPYSVPFRPPRITPKPFVQGTQTAIVVGPAGEEIYTDKYGRVKVQFHWDRRGRRDENSSCWIRVSQPWAGKGWGAMSIPRIGQEVVVDFLEGDPDRPIITGRVYNAGQMPPYGLPAGGVVSGLKTNSTKGGGGYNEMSMDDTKGKEKITIHGQYDMATTIEHDDTQTIHNNRIITVDGTHHETIKKDTTVLVTEGKETNTVKQQILITSQTAHIHLTAATEIKLEVGASKLLMKSNGSIELSGVNIAINGSQSVKTHGGDVSSEADANHNIKGAIVLSEGSGTNTVKGGMVMLNP